ncbi:MAG: Hsp70 family protein [Cyanobacteriota bacterium]|nr:Hsp70 family protein [Cyanobacteriota bacterium]
MGRAVGIDLGTTNSEVAIVENGQPRILPDERGDLILPSCVGFDDQGKLVVGREALRQYAAAPERTVRSIKRWMGTDHVTTLRVGGLASEETKDFSPQEISAIILRTLKQRAETALGEAVTEAVITVPAYFTDAQRQATKQAGEIAGLNVLQIINEPTAAALTYNIRSEETERVLVYDLGGGTFDVSVVEITGAVTEVLASHGNNRLGGDDFDRRLELHLADRFRQLNDADLPEDPLVQARLLQAAEQVKIALSANAFTPVREAYLGTKGSAALHLETEVARKDFEDLIRPLLTETLEAIDRALADARLKPEDLDRVILVGGSTRIPLAQEMVAEHLGQRPVDGVQPDLCVALGAALQAGVLVGEAVESILVDVIPHSLGISVVQDTPFGLLPGFFSVIIPRNSVIPISRSEVYSTAADNQDAVEIEVFQGENQIAEENVPLGAYKVENLPPRPAGGVAIEVHFDFDINGILTVTSTEKGSNQSASLVINNAGVQKLSSQELKQAREDLDSLFGEEEEAAESAVFDAELEAAMTQAQGVLANLDAEKAEELRELMSALEEAAGAGDGEKLGQLQGELTDFLYYLDSEEA